MTTAVPVRTSSDQTTSASTSVPVLGEGFQETPATPDAQTNKKHSWKLGKKKDTQSSEYPAANYVQSLEQLRDANSAQSAGATPVADMTSQSDASGLRSTSPMGFQRTSSPKPAPASPGRVGQSPRMASPASSQIFERSVQEEVAAATSPAIPAHIATENHIPPVLESASKAITDDHLDPDAVEIVTHLAHQPASAAVVSGTSTTELPLTPLHPAQNMTQSFSLDAMGAGMGAATTTAGGIGTNLTGTEPAHDSLSTEKPASPIGVPAMGSSLLGRVSPPISNSDSAAGLGSDDGSAPNYGSLDSNDVRRLSFISFADVVHAEHLGGGDGGPMRDSLVVSPNAAVAGSPLASGLGMPRSPSPMRSPASPSLSAASGAGSLHPDDGSPSRHPTSTSPLPVGLGMGGSMAGALHGTSPPAGELAIETMGQALRNTNSRDLGAVRSSVVLEEEQR